MTIGIETRKQQLTRKAEDQFARAATRESAFRAEREKAQRADAAKIARLRALRLAKEEADAQTAQAERDAAPAGASKTRPRAKRVRKINISP